MTHNERRKKRMQERREAGLCPECGKPMDRDGYRCSECLKKHREYNNATRKFRKEHGFCPECGKNRLFGDEKICPECTANGYAWTMKNRRENKNRYNAYMRQYHRDIYRERKEKGICTRCGKRPASFGYYTCATCREKEAERARVRSKKDPKNRKERQDKGLCWFCGKPVEPGYKVCEEHHAMCKRNATTQAANEARKKLIKEGILW